MGNETTTDRIALFTTGANKSGASSLLKSSGRKLFNFVSGLAILYFLWWLGVFILASNPATEHFADFGPIPAFHAMPMLWEEGVLQSAVASSGYRLGAGLLIAIAIGAPIGVLMGRSMRTLAVHARHCTEVRHTWQTQAVKILIAAKSYPVVA